jgi:NitT/TauT family transport system permease protein
LAEWFSTGQIWVDLGITLLETALSFIFGIGGGIVLGLWLGLTPFAAAVMNPFIKVFNAIPRVLLAPM